jgi:hypothetical protein
MLLVAELKMMVREKGLLEYMGKRRLQSVVSEVCLLFLPLFHYAIFAFCFIVFVSDFLMRLHAFLPL